MHVKLPVRALQRKRRLQAKASNYGQSAGEHARNTVQHFRALGHSQLCSCLVQGPVHLAGNKYFGFARKRKAEEGPGLRGICNG